MIRSKKIMLDTSKMLYASLAELTSEDFEANKLFNVHITCTHQGYIVGEKYVDKDGNLMFLDLLSDENPYPYFKTISQAQEILQASDEKFVINANELSELGINGYLEIEELKDVLRNKGLYFKFIDDELNNVDVKTKKDRS